MTAVIYARYNVRKREKFVSVTTQMNKCRGFCGAHSLEILGLFEDNEGLAEGFDSALSLAIANKSVFLCYDLTRLPYRLVSLTGFFRSLIDAGGAFVSLIERLDTRTPEGMHFLAMLDNVEIAHRESYSIQATRDRREMLADNLIVGGIIPYGFSLHRTDPKRLVQNDSEKVIVDLMCDLYNGGLNTKQIGESLEARAIDPRKGQKWSAGLINNILRRYGVQIRPGKYLDHGL